jgi:hypothetical protein
MSVNVRSINGENYLIPYLEKMTLKQLKLRIKQFQSVDIANQVIMYNGRELQPDTVMLEDFGVNKGETVFFFVFF